MSKQSKFYRKTPLIGAGTEAGQDATKIKALGKLLVTNDIETTRQANIEAGLLDPKDFLDKKTAAKKNAKTSAIDVVFVEAYQQIQKLTNSDEEARKKAYKIAMAYQDMLFKEIDKVYPSATSQRIVIDRPLVK